MRESLSDVVGLLERVCVILHRSIEVGAKATTCQIFQLRIDVDDSVCEVCSFFFKPLKVFRLVDDLLVIVLSGHNADNPKT